jgi:hypothetical protein
VRKIPLTKGKWALVDDEDYDAVMSRGQWYAQKGCADNYYAMGRGSVMMHRLIVDAPQDAVVDHINGDGLDNRRENLRLATKEQNARNTNRGWGTSKYLGVSWSEKAGKWQAQTRIRKVPHNLGFFDSEIEAARAVDRKRREVFGDFAKPNVPTESLPEEDQRHLFE